MQYLERPHKMYPARLPIAHHPEIQRYPSDWNRAMRAILAIMLMEADIDRMVVVFPGCLLSTYYYLTLCCTNLGKPILTQLLFCIAVKCMAISLW